MPAGPDAIRVYGDPCLRRKARPVRPDEAAGLLDDLWTALRDGVGLAAPQIGRDRRAIVVRDPGVRGPRGRYELIDPELVASFGPSGPFEEGCLSFPGLYLRIWRPRGVVVRYRDRAGAPRELRDEGLVARVVQHELDHLEGILYIDRLPRWRRALLAPRLQWLKLRAGRGGA